MKNIIYTFITLVFWGSASIIGGSASSTPYAPILESRSADTCADASLAVTYVQEFNPALVAFALTTSGGWAAGITEGPTTGWIYSGEVFLGWDVPDPQGFTTPLYLLYNPTSMDYIVEISTDGNPPSVPGFTVQGVAGNVYSTQVCGSVPLLGAFNSAAGNHYYTTKTNDHAQLITNAGWVDAGIAAYVLPLSAAPW